MLNKNKILSALLASIMIFSAVSCSRDTSSEDEDETEGYESETEEEEESEPETEVTTVVTSEETTVPSETTETEPAPEERPSTIDISEQYDLFTAFAAGEYENDPGAKFSFITNYYDGELYWMLAAGYSDGSTVVYKTEDSAVVPAEDNEISDNAQYYAETTVIPYEQFKDYPCIIDMDLYGAPYEITESIPDGFYYGEALAFSMDGNYALVQYGKGVIYTEDEYNALSVGDTVTYPGWDGEDHIATVISVDDGWVTFDDSDVWFVQGAYTPDPTQYCLLTYSDNPLYSYEGVALLPISDECEVTDTFGMLYTDLEWTDYNLEPKTGEPLLDSFYFYLETHVPFASHYVSNGWMETYGLLYPIVVTDGQVTVLNIEWR